MSRRFSSQQLFDLRNHIPIEILITEVLAVPTRRSGGHLRFRCPACTGFHTAIHPHENLARCFDCEKNFNPIDLVMCEKKISFAESVRFLGQLSVVKRKREAAIAASTLPSVGHVLSKMPLSPTSSCPSEQIIQTRDILRRIQILEQKVALLLKLSSTK
jgi:hypothetical protein